MSSRSRRFYITILKKDGDVVGHVVGQNPPNRQAAHFSQAASPQTQKPAALDDIVEFEKVFRSFSSVMESYRNFIPMTLSFAPALSAAIAERKITDFAKKKGAERPDLSDENNLVYELDFNSYREFSVHQDDVIAAIDGSKYLPEVMIIGLVGAYDAFLSQLLRVIINRHEEIILTSEKTIKFSELKEFASIETARQALIDREIESVIRSSHHEQFEWMERKFSMKLREDLSVWPAFIELCERRNLLTHTGGIVSAKYLDICRSHGCSVSGVQVGDKLGVQNEYFSSAVSTVYELGIKLCYVMWRKFATNESARADTVLNELGFNLIFGRAYKIAEAILAFGAATAKNRNGNDRTRRMMIVNLANAVRLQGRASEARLLVEKEDWSAVGREFKICVAAVKEDTEEVVRLMREIGKNGSPGAEDYRAWPVFRGIRADEKFMSAFEDTFGEAIFPSKAVEITPSGDVEIKIEDRSKEPETEH